MGAYKSGQIVCFKFSLEEQYSIFVVGFGFQLFLIPILDFLQQFWDKNIRLLRGPGFKTEQFSSGTLLI